MRSITLYLSIVLAQCLWVSGDVSAADRSSSLRTNFGMTIIATDLAMHELPPVLGRAMQAPIASASSPVSVPKSLSGLWHEPVVASASTCSLLGANWCLALQSGSPAPAVLGVSHSADGEDPAVAFPIQTQAPLGIMPNTPQLRMPTAANQPPIGLQQ